MSRTTRVVRSMQLMSQFRAFSTESKVAYKDIKPKTAVVMLNMGGPADPTPECVGSFLTNLFSDKMIINLGKWQRFGKWFAEKRTPKITEQYKAIGGSPIRKWTDLQGEAMCRKLDEISPSSAPHKHYTMFRYANPMTQETLEAMKADGVTRAVAFSQYPMYSCTTSGASITHLWEKLAENKMENDIKWSVIDRWNDHPRYIAALARRIELGLEQYPEEVRKDVVILFSGHSIPIKTVELGDQYEQEVCHTVQRVMSELKYSNPYMLSWQSKVGYLPWLTPSTSAAIDGLHKQGLDNALCVAVSFTSDHVETLFEIDIEYADHARKVGMTGFKRAPALNDEPLLTSAQAEIVSEHLSKNENYASRQYEVKCMNCINPLCRTVTNPVNETSRK